MKVIGSRHVSVPCVVVSHVCQGGGRHRREGEEQQGGGVVEPLQWNRMKCADTFGRVGGSFNVCSSSRNERDCASLPYMYVRWHDRQQVNIHRSGVVGEFRGENVLGEGGNQKFSSPEVLLKKQQKQ